MLKLVLKTTHSTYCSGHQLESTIARYDDNTLLKGQSPSAQTSDLPQHGVPSSGRSTCPEEVPPSDQVAVSLPHVVSNFHPETPLVSHAALRQESLYPQ